MKNALIIGINSVIGMALHEELIVAGWRVYGTSRRKENVTDHVFYLDLLNATTFQLDVAIDVVFLCASVTNIATCREQSEVTKIINHDAQIILAKYFIDRKIHIVFLSTVGVFNGQKPAYRTDDATNPITLYGKYKANVERQLLSLSSNVSIVRLTKVLTPEHTLIIGWLNLIKQGICISSFYDLKLAPISIALVTRYLRKIGEEKILGLMHLSGEKDVSYFDLALYLVDAMKCSRNLIESRSVVDSDIPLSEIHPYASLDISESKRLFESNDVSLGTVLTSLYGDLWFNQNNNCSSNRINLD